MPAFAVAARADAGARPDRTMMSASPRDASAVARAADAYPILALRDLERVEPFGVARKQLLLLLAQNAGQRDRAARQHVLREARRQLEQRSGKNIREQNVRVHLWKMLRKIQIH